MEVNLLWLCFCRRQEARSRTESQEEGRGLRGEGKVGHYHMREWMSEWTRAHSRITGQQICGQKPQGRPVSMAVYEASLVRVRSRWGAGFNLAV